jgi:dephospho-CoA kinase
MPDQHSQHRKNVQLVIGVAGRIGSGKSVVAHYLEREFGFQYFRYSLVLADWFETEPDAKARLQEVGWEVMSGSGQRELNQRLIAQIDRDKDCAVDGLRHPIDYENLKKEFGSRFYLIVVDTPTEVRFARLRERYATYQEFVAADLHPVESNIESLRPLASAFLSGTLHMERLASDLSAFLRTLRPGGTEMI